jgi:hypothetical protein
MCMNHWQTATGEGVGLVAACQLDCSEEPVGKWFVTHTQQPVCWGLFY